MSGYSRYPANSGGVPTYANFASLPSGQVDGTLGIALDSHILYEYNANTVTWVAIGGPGATLSVGTIDSQAKAANGAVIASNAIVMQTADATHPGLISDTTQTIAGAKTFTGAISASNLSGTNSGDVTVGTGNGLSLAAQILSLDLSSGSTTGALSSTDWNTFNAGAALAATSLQINGNALANIPFGGTLGSQPGGFGGAATNIQMTTNAGADFPFTVNDDGNYIVDINILKPSDNPNLDLNNSRLHVYGQSVFESNIKTVFRGGLGTDAGCDITSLLHVYDGNIGGGYPTVLISKYSGGGQTTDITQWTEGDSTTILAKIDADGNISAVNLSGTNTGDVSLGTANGLSLTNHVLSLDLSSTATTGALSDTDWNTFNSKQAAGNYITDLTGDVTASGPGSVAAAVAKIQGTTVSGTTGSVNVVFSSAPTLSNPVVGTQSQGDGSTKAASTAYVDVAIANAVAGVNPAVAVQAATTAAGDTSALAYNNGVSGIGATLTGANNTALTVDGYTFTALGQRLLVKNDTQSPSGAFNGVYYVTQVQAALLPLVLTRALDFDMPSDMNNTGAIPVINGTVNGTTSWVLSSQVVTVGTTPLTFAQFTKNPNSYVSTTLTSAHILVGNGSNVATDVAMSGDIAISNAGVTSYAGTLAVNKGGTGQTSYTDGQLLIGNSSGNTLTKAALTAGSGISITNGNGSISIAASPSYTAPAPAVLTSTGTTAGYIFTITSGNATVGATYTNNGNTYTVLATVASKVNVWMSGTGATSGSTLTKATGTGDATLTFSLAQPLATWTATGTPLYIKVRGVGGGGGGGSGGTASLATGTNGTITAFGIGHLLANGGQGGGNTSVPIPAGGSVVTGGASAPTALVAMTGNPGGILTNNGNSTATPAGGTGGASPFGGAGAGGWSSQGGAAAANSGSGGGGGSMNGTTGGYAGAGGGAGGYFEAMYTSGTTSTFYYCIGAKGTGAAAGTNGYAGTDGGTGVIIVEPYYQ